MALHVSYPGLGINHMAVRRTGVSGTLVVGSWDTPFRCCTSCSTCAACGSVAVVLVSLLCVFAWTVALVAPDNLQDVCGVIVFMPVEASRQYVCASQLVLHLLTFHSPLQCRPNQNLQSLCSTAQHRLPQLSHQPNALPLTWCYWMQLLLVSSAA